MFKRREVHGDQKEERCIQFMLKRSGQQAIQALQGYFTINREDNEKLTNRNNNKNKTSKIIIIFSCVLLVYSINLDL